MSKQDSGEQVKFLVSCIRHASNGKPDFAAVAEQLGIVSKAAAQKRYERMLKAHGVNGSKAGANLKPADDAPTPQSSPVKRKLAARRPARAAAAAKKPKKEPDEDGAEVKAEPKKNGAVAKEDDESELSDAPPSPSESET
ncbi:hypothetical protein CDD83_3658 [Cordyceps sp. RAO-2017]|nr:hypothetical protein CDD83_3658 [Cordyceps sp. RAO-2017]